MERTSVDDLFAGDDVSLGDDGGAVDDTARATATGGWIYLGLLGAIFLVLAGVAYGCERDPLSDRETVTGAIEPVEVVLRVSGTTVTLEGRVPDAEVRDQLVALGGARYGEGNVADALVLDERTTLERGAVSVTGTTVEGDPNPAGLQADIASALELRPGEVDLTYRRAPEAPAEQDVPADVGVALAPASASLSGSVPDEAAVAALVAATEGVWGPADTEALVVADVVWSGATVVVGGTADIGDPRPAELVEALRASLPEGVEVDASALVVDASAEALQRQQQRLAEELRAAPISFLGGSAQIDPASEPALLRLADVLMAMPEVGVEIVGFSDPFDDPALAPVESQQRAEAVVARLVQLGVDPARLSAVGAGGADPIAPSDSDEGRSRNRRVAVRFASPGG